MFTIVARDPVASPKVKKAFSELLNVSESSFCMTVEDPDGSVRYADEKDVFVAGTLSHVHRHQTQFFLKVPNQKTFTCSFFDEPNGLQGLTRYNFAKAPCELTFRDLIEAAICLLQHGDDLSVAIKEFTDHNYFVINSKVIGFRAEDNHALNDRVVVSGFGPNISIIIMCRLFSCNKCPECE